MLTVKRIIGDSEITYVSDAKDLKEDILRVTWLTSASTNCGACSSPNISLQGKITGEGEFTYAEFVCKDCNSRVQMGEFKSPKGALFLKKEWTKWEGKKVE